MSYLSDEFGVLLDKQHEGSFVSNLRLEYDLSTPNSTEFTKYVKVLSFVQISTLPFLHNSIYDQLLSMNVETLNDAELNQLITVLVRLSKKSYVRKKTVSTRKVLKQMKKIQILKELQFEDDNMNLEMKQNDHNNGNNNNNSSNFVKNVLNHVLGNIDITSNSMEFHVEDMILLDISVMNYLHEKYTMKWNDALSKAFLRLVYKQHKDKYANDIEASIHVLRFLPQKFHEYVFNSILPPPSSDDYTLYADENVEYFIEAEKENDIYNMIYVTMNLILCNNYMDVKYFDKLIDGIDICLMHLKTSDVSIRNFDIITKQMFEFFNTYYFRYWVCKWYVSTVLCCTIIVVITILQNCVCCFHLISIGSQQQKCIC